MNINNNQYELLCLFKQILNKTSSEILLILDEQFNLLFINDSAKKFYHCTDDDLIKIKFSDFCLQKQINSDFYSFVHHIVKKSDPYQENFYNYMELIWSIEIIPFEQFKFYVIKTTNFTQKKHKEAIHNLETLIENMPCNVYWMDKNCLMVGCNQNVLNMLQMRKNDFIGKSYEELSTLCRWPEGLALKLKNDDLTVLNTGNPILDVEDPPIPNQNGSFFYFLTSRVPLYSQNGEIIGVAGISTDISALKHAQKQAEAANLAKTEFIANMSHDIRTPLTGVIGLSEILEQSLQHPEEKEKAHLLHGSGEELLHMLNDILDDIRAGNLRETDLNNHAFDLHQCIANLIRLESPATRLKGLALKTDITPAVPRYIHSDRNKIHRILLNLMGNAIKFTQSGCITLGVDCLHCDDKEAHLKFSVSDTGIGIPEEA
ncbi:MAG: hybrid sensor histidine kinase/response regulator, partial [Chitinophaga sp.]|nr:hybrid sensor histidine kinase/response regulator [Chitinophaga sp.]